MRISDLQKVWVDADLAAAHACVLCDNELEEAYVNLRRAAGRVLTALGQERTVARLRATSHRQEDSK